MTPNPSPRSAASAVTAQSRSVARCPSAGSPSRPEPSTSVQRHPRPPSRRRIDSWASTVQAIMTPVTSPAPRLSLPPRITHSGATPTSSAYPENHSVAAVSSHDMPGSRQTGRLGGACPGAAPPSGAVARRSGAGMREDLVRGAGAGTQGAFHQARPGPGGVLPGEVDPAQGRGDELVVTGGRGDGRRGVRLARPRVVVPGGQHGPAEVQG